MVKEQTTCQHQEHAAPLRFRVAYPSCGYTGASRPRARLRNSTAGFTMAELLTVVAILFILMAIAGIAVSNYLRDLTLTEYDNAAKSIYIAAQNNIADLQASGEWVANEKAEGSQDGRYTPKGNASIPNVESAQGAYYYLTAQMAQENGILPVGTIDPEVWGNAYIIEYDYETASVYGVFYTEGAQGKLDEYYQSGASVRERETRRMNDPIIGYYGDADAVGLETATLTEPKVMAGRSSVLAVTDSNLVFASTSTTEKRLNTVTLLTLEKEASVDASADQKASVQLVLKCELKNSPKVYVVADGKLELVASDFCTMSDFDGKTYSLNLTKMKEDARVGALLADLGPGDEYSVTARTSTSVVLARPVYGYGTGVWPSSDDVVFTANIIADYESEADLYVYKDDANADVINGLGFQVNLENWYNASTRSGEDLFYRIIPADGISVGSIYPVDDASETVDYSKSISQVASDCYSYPYSATVNVAHQVQFSLANAAQVAEGTVLDIKFNAYRSGTVDKEAPGATVEKILTVHVHVMNQRGYSYDVVDHGAYAEVIVKAGDKALDGVAITAKSGSSVGNWTDSAMAQRTNDGRTLTLKPLPAGSSTSVKFLKTNVNVTLNRDSFIFNPSDGQGV